MNLFTRWASREYPLPLRVLGTLPAGILFVYLIPLMLVRLGPRLDALLHWPRLAFGAGNLIAGGLLVVMGAFFALWSIVAQFSLAGGTPLPLMATQTLLVKGPFKLCRNPMSLGTISLYTGVALLAGSISSIAIVALLAALLLTYLKRVEEHELEARFGAAYRAYKVATPFLIPRLWSRRK